MHNPKDAFIILPELGGERRSMRTALTFGYHSGRDGSPSTFLLGAILAYLLQSFLKLAMASWVSLSQKSVVDELCIRIRMEDKNLPCSGTMLFSSPSCQEWRHSRAGSKLCVEDGRASTSDHPERLHGVGWPADLFACSVLLQQWEINYWVWTMYNLWTIILVTVLNLKLGHRDCYLCWAHM